MLDKNLFLGVLQSHLPFNVVCMLKWLRKFGWCIYEIAVSLLWHFVAYFNRKYISILASNLCFWEVLSSNLCILRLKLNVCFTKTTRGRQCSNFASLQSLVIVYQFNSRLSFWAPFSRSSGATGWPSWLRWLVSASDPLVPGWAWNAISSVSLVVTFLVHGGQV